MKTQTLQDELSTVYRKLKFIEPSQHMALVITGEPYRPMHSQNERMQKKLYHRLSQIKQVSFGRAIVRYLGHKLKT
jgi:hypothetical protein